MCKYEFLKKEDREGIKAVVEIHIKAFPSFFLTKLGEKILYELYNGFLITENAGIIVGKKEKKIVSFIAFSENNKSIYLSILKKRILRFTFYFILLFFKKPKIAIQLIQKVFKKSDTKEYENLRKIRISSIAVNPELSNNGLGRNIFEFFKKHMEKKYEVIELETDKDSNEKVNAFYTSLNFLKIKEIRTFNSRKMNIYYYYLK